MIPPLKAWPVVNGRGYSALNSFDYLWCQRYADPCHPHLRFNCHNGIWVIWWQQRFERGASPEGHRALLSNFSGERNVPPTGSPKIRVLIKIHYSRICRTPCNKPGYNLQILWKRNWKSWIDFCRQPHLMHYCLGFLVLVLKKVSLFIMCGGISQLLRVLIVYKNYNCKWISNG